MAVEIVSAGICFVLLWFMAKPYGLTREGRYLGLPLGFGFLGISYIITAVAISIPGYFANQLSWLQLLPRTFAFLFFAVTYYFSGETSRNSRLIWNLTISLIIFALATSVMAVIIVPLNPNSYLTSSVYFRTFNLICLSYISVRTLNSHTKTLEPSTVVVPFGFILLGINQYSILVWSVDRGYFAFWGALVVRLAALAVFVFVAYRAFLGSDSRVG